MQSKKWVMGTDNYVFRCFHGSPDILLKMLIAAK